MRVLEAENPNARARRAPFRTGTFFACARWLTMTIERDTPRIPTPEERKARDAARRADAEQAMREHEAAQRAFHQNRERLKSERLAREAAKSAGRRDRASASAD